jgi:hypothetical protein
MDSTTIRQLRREWQALGTAPASREAYRRLAGREPVVDRLGVDDLAGLVATLMPSSARLSRDEAATVVAAMLRSADVDELIPRALVQALVPGVLALARRFELADGPWSDLDAFYADAISCLWEQISTWSGTTRPYAAGDLISGARTRLRTLQATERRHRSRRADTSDALDLVPAIGDRTGEELLATALADATGQGLTVADAAVLYATSVLGLSLAELSDLGGEPVPRLRHQRRTAIAQLVA